MQACITVKYTYFAHIMLENAKTNMPWILNPLKLQPLAMQSQSPSTLLLQAMPASCTVSISLSLTQAWPQITLPLTCMVSDNSAPHLHRLRSCCPSPAWPQIMLPLTCMASDHAAPHLQGLRSFSPSPAYSLRSCCPSSARPQITLPLTRMA